MEDATRIHEPAIAPVFDPNVAPPTKTLVQSADIPRPSTAGLGPPTVAGYDIHEEIGRGGMGIVYRARDLGLQRDVAIKLLHDRFDPTSAVASRFLDEARITGQMQHPGVPAVHQVGTLANGRPYLAMKLVKGETLDVLLARGPVNVLAIFESICQTVGYAHAHEVVHRDLKPANVMIGSFGEVQVMDWGLAKVVRKAEARGRPADSDTAIAATEIRSFRDGDGSFTHAGMMIGTPMYMPPEQAGGEVEKVDPRSDVFGLGAILCVLLTGKPPFDGDTAEAVRLNAIRGNVDGALARLDACGREPELIDLCKRCLRFDPNARPANGRAVAEETAAFRTAADERARQAELERSQAEVRVAEQAKRRRVMRIAAWSVSACLVAGILGTTYGLIRADRKARDASNAADRERLARQDAEAAHDRARRRYDLALEAFDRMVFELPKALAPIPGTQRVRKDLLTNARTGLKQLMAETDSGSVPDRTLIAMYYRSGDLEDVLGNLKDAVRDYRAGVALADDLHARDPENEEAYLDRFRGHLKLGSLHLSAGRPADANESYASLLRLATGRVERNPDLPGGFNDLAVAHLKLGAVALTLRKADEAKDHVETAYDIAKKLADDNPDNVKFLQGLCAAEEKMGDVCNFLGRTDDALRHFESLVGHYERTAEKAPPDANAQYSLNLAYGRVGATLVFLKRPADALVPYEKARASAARLVEADPQNVVHRRELANAYHNLGDATSDLGRLDAAHEHYQEAVKISKSLAEADVENVLTQMNVFILYDNLATVERSRYEFAKSREYHERARGIAKPWHDKQRLVGQFKNALADTEREIATCREFEAVLADREAAFRLPAERVHTAVLTRTEAMLYRKDSSEAVKTADRYAKWTRERPDRKADFLRSAARLYTLCAKALPDPDRRNELVSKCLSLFEEILKDVTTDRQQFLDAIRKDKVFDAIRNSPEFEAFVKGK